MTNCLYCNAEIEQKNGGKERKFCDNNNSCKQAYHNKNKKPPKYVLFSTFQELQEKFNALNGKNTQETQNKPQEATKKENEGESILKIDNSLILAEIEKVKAAKIPDGMSKKVWEFDQNKKLKALQSQLK